MCFHSRNIPAKFHPDWIWNDRALGFFGWQQEQEEQQKEEEQDE